MGNCLRREKDEGLLDDGHVPGTKKHWEEYEESVRQREKAKREHRGRMDKLADMRMHPEKYKKENEK